MAIVRVNHPALVRGYIDEMKVGDHELAVRGWMVQPHRPLSAFQAHLDGSLAGALEPLPREDVAKAFPWISHTRQSGFEFRLPISARRGRIDIVGLRGHRPVARLTSLYRTDLGSAIATPPATLMVRALGNASPDFYRADGLKSFSEFSDAASRHRELVSIRRMLDWGCGCGRVTVQFLLDGTIPEVFGCDIDGEAIAWCQQHLREGKFQRIEPYPPTPYPDQSFDLVIAYSVFTHLSRDLQNAWLTEMRRIISPGGLFIASVHGPFATSFAFSPTSLGRFVPRLRDRFIRHTILREGIVDTTVDHALNGVAPEGYYRGVFQTREHTMKAWSKFFEILEYAEGGVGNFQDLVVMRRPA